MRLGLHRNHGKHFVPQLPIINQSINIFLHTTLGMGEIKIITCHSWLVRVIRLVESAMGNPDPPQLLIGIIRCHVVFYQFLKIKTAQDEYESKICRSCYLKMNTSKINQFSTGKYSQIKKDTFMNLTFLDFNNICDNIWIQ